MFLSLRYQWWPHIFAYTRTHAWLPQLCLRCDTSEMITDKSGTSQSWHFLVHTMSVFLNLKLPNFNLYPPYMTTFCQFKVLLFFSVFYQLTLIVIVLQTVNTALMVWSAFIMYNWQHYNMQNVKISLYYWNRHNTLHACIQYWHKAKIIKNLKWIYSDLAHWTC
jgi:hypothetical protein